MSDDDFTIEAPGMTAWEIDHLADPRDDADALVILLEERIAEATAQLCPGCKQPEPCDCAPITHAEMRAMAARHADGPMRYRGVR